MASSSIISSIPDNIGDSFASSPTPTSSSGSRNCVWDLRTPTTGISSPDSRLCRHRHRTLLSTSSSEPPEDGASKSEPPNSHRLNEEQVGATLLSSAAAPVQTWLNELRWHTEPECSHILQSKSILSHSQSSFEPPAVLNVSSRAAIEVICTRSGMISGELKKVFKIVSRVRVKELNHLIAGLTAHVRALLHSMNSMSVLRSPQHAKAESSLRRYCSKLEDAAKNFMAQNGRLPTAEPLTRELTRLAHAFSRLVDGVLGDLTFRLVSCVSVPETQVTALRDITYLAMRFDHLASTFAKIGALSSVINVCRDVTLQSQWSIALRTISAVCCVPEAVQRFQEDRGLDLLRVLLCDSGLPELIRCEAAGVVAQITSPSLCNSQGVHPLGQSWSHMMDDLVRSLTMLSMEAGHPDIFLLSAAALANLTFLDPSVFGALMRFRTVKVLVDACQLNKADSVFARDQVATLFANMAVCASCHEEITSLNGIELLLQFLAESPSDCKDAGEHEACARLQQKAAIALGRLSSLSSNAQIIIECEGLRRLAVLCHRPEERAGSDAVLVAALAALRKIHLACGPEDFEEGVLHQLVYPKMIDAFLVCSKMEESFV